MLGNTRFISRVNMISHSFAALTREKSCSTLEINMVFPRTHVLFSIYSFIAFHIPIAVVKSARPLHTADQFVGRFRFEVYDISQT